MNKIVVGDLHGHYDELMLLYKKITEEWSLNPEVDQLIFLGDYVDGGYKTKEVLNQLIKWNKLYPHWKFLLGNHEDMLLDALQNPLWSDEFDLWYTQGGRATALSYTPDDKQYYDRHAASFIDKKHIKWMNSLPLYYEDSDYIYVHAGVNPYNWNGSMDNQKKLDLIWIRNEFINSQIDFGKKIIFGHTTFKEPLVMKNKIGIDMMYHNKGSICAVRLPQEEFLFQESVTIPRRDWDIDRFDISLYI